jgi:tRNA threonylcarbamoyladenosine biosynthesis protein TsaB
MYLLTLDTASNAGGVALARNSEVVGQVMMKTPMRYSDNLIPMIDFLLQHHQLQPEGLDGLVVAIGPGSFTGLRIGLAAAKALGQALSLPAVGISSLEALAFRFRHVHTCITPMIDARRQQVYAGIYEVSETGCRSIVPEAVAPPAQWLKEKGSADAVYVGDGATLYRSSVEALVPGARFISTDNSVLNSLCHLGFRRFSEGRGKPVGKLAANYVRPPDAKLNSRLPTGVS